MWCTNLSGSVRLHSEKAKHGGLKARCGPTWVSLRSSEPGSTLHGDQVPASSHYCCTHIHGSYPENKRRFELVSQHCPLQSACCFGFLLFWFNRLDSMTSEGLGPLGDDAFGAPAETSNQAPWGAEDFTDEPLGGPVEQSVSDEPPPYDSVVLVRLRRFAVGACAICATCHQLSHDLLLLPCQSHHPASTAAPASAAAAEAAAAATSAIPAVVYGVRGCTLAGGCATVLASTHVDRGTLPTPPGNTGAPQPRV